MKLRLNRLFSYARPEGIKLLGFLCGIYVVLTAYRILTHELYLWNFLLLTGIVLLIWLIFCLSHSRCAEVQGKQIVVGSLHPTVYTDVRRVSFEQTAFEKKWDAGRIVFEGKNDSRESGENGSRTGFCVLYGVTHFEKTADDLRALLPKECFEKE